MVARKMYVLGIAVCFCFVIFSIWYISTTSLNRTSLQNTLQKKSICPASALEKFSQADLVLSGTVFMVVPDQELARVIITPEKIYKGTLTQPTVAILAREEEPVTAVTPGAIPTLHFQTGQLPYLLYLDDRHDGTYSTSICNGTRLLGSGLSDEEVTASQGGNIDETH